MPSLQESSKTSHPVPCCSHVTDGLAVASDFKTQAFPSSGDKHWTLYRHSFQLHSSACRFFPSVYYLSTSKVAIAVLGNFAFAVALCTYFFLTKVNSPCLYAGDTPCSLACISSKALITCAPAPLHACMLKSSGPSVHAVLRITVQAYCLPSCTGSTEAVSYCKPCALPYS